ncbi:MAG: DUF4124 domain-containing protein [Candidatus Riflebacteria bacterium]|nr:DUF4124 domain-containing protein [Candidatus Riflebacteria bacterium]
MKKVCGSRCFIISLLMFIPLFVPSMAGASDFLASSFYQCIKEFGPEEVLMKKVGPGEVLKYADDGKNAYILKKVQIKDENHLIQLMGSDSESKLTDGQRGLLETYRFSRSPEYSNFSTYFSSVDVKINLVLSDITGFEDIRKYPDVKETFWPSIIKDSSNAKQIHSTMNISSVPYIGGGSSTGENMKKAFAHEFGHGIDMTRRESGGYGPDEDHYANEIIQPRSAFTEGFANFITIHFFPDKISYYKGVINELWKEEDKGKYKRVTVNDMEDPTQLLQVEGVNALILADISKELPNGIGLIMQSFTRHNSSNTTMMSFLKKLVADFPVHAAVIAEILDRHTSGRLLNSEIRTILGSSPGVEGYLAKRKDPLRKSKSPDVTVKKPEPSEVQKPPPVPSPKVVPGKSVYVWKDAQGRKHFSDRPPEPGIEYEMRFTTPVEVKSSDTNPFAE